MQSRCCNVSGVMKCTERDFKESEPPVTKAMLSKSHDECQLICVSALRVFSGILSLHAYVSHLGV